MTVRDLQIAVCLALAVGKQLLIRIENGYGSFHPHVRGLTGNFAKSLAIRTPHDRFSRGTVVKRNYKVCTAFALPAGHSRHTAMQHAVDMLEAMSARLRAVRNCEEVGRR